MMSAARITPVMATIRSMAGIVVAVGRATARASVAKQRREERRIAVVHSSAPPLAIESPRQQRHRPSEQSQTNQGEGNNGFDHPCDPRVSWCSRAPSRRRRK